MLKISIGERPKVYFWFVLNLEHTYRVEGTSIENLIHVYRLMVIVISGGCEAQCDCGVVRVNQTEIWNNF